MLFVIFRPVFCAVLYTSALFAFEATVFRKPEYYPSEVRSLQTLISCHYWALNYSFSLAERLYNMNKKQEFGTQAVIYSEFSEVITGSKSSLSRFHFDQTLLVTIDELLSGLRLDI